MSTIFRVALLVSVRFVRAYTAQLASVAPVLAWNILDFCALRCNPIGQLGDSVLLFFGLGVYLSHIVPMAKSGIKEKKTPPPKGSAHMTAVASHWSKERTWLSSQGNMRP